jgi:hypothetical protein
MRACRSLLAVLFLVALPLAVRAEHASIDLRLIRLDAANGQTLEETDAHADQEPPAGGVNPRPLAKVKAGEPLVLQFFLTNTYPHGENKDVGVHYYVVREEKPRQKMLPDLSKGVVTEGRFKSNFKPKCRVGARVAFTIKEPGIYLLRVDTSNTNSDHEHFSAIDVQVE